MHQTFTFFINQAQEAKKWFLQVTSSELRQFGILIQQTTWSLHAKWKRKLILVACMDNMSMSIRATCHLDYCNSLLYGISITVSAECCSALGHRCSLVYYHITLLLQQPHWLPFCRQVIFKVVGLIHQSLAAVVPVYLMYNCWLLPDVRRRTLRSSSNDMRMLVVLQMHNKFGDRSFLSASPRLWNDLSPQLQRRDLSFSVFRQHMNTFLFDYRT